MSIHRYVHTQICLYTDMSIHRYAHTQKYICPYTDMFMFIRMSSYLQCIYVFIYIIIWQTEAAMIVATLLKIAWSSFP